MKSVKETVPRSKESPAVMVIINGRKYPSGDGTIGTFVEFQSVRYNEGGQTRFISLKAGRRRTGLSTVGHCLLTKILSSWSSGTGKQVHSISRHLRPFDNSVLSRSNPSSELVSAPSVSHENRTDQRQNPLIWLVVR